MASNVTLAEYSNLFVYSSITVFVIAFVLFTVTMAKRSVITQEPTVNADARVPVGAAVGANLGASASSDADTGANGRRPEYVQHAPENARRLGNIAFALTWLATGLLLAGIVCRGLSAGRPPWGNMYEYSLMIAVIASIIFLVLSTRTDVRWLGVMVTGAVVLILGVAVTVLYTESAPLVPALRSYWLVIHVISVITASAAFTVGGLVTALYLLRERAESKAGTTQLTSGFVSKLPAADRLDTLSYRIFAVTFPLWTFAVIAGAIWAEAAWGRYWGWDPKETWSFITWVVFAGYLHARATAGWSGRKAATIAMIGFATIIINYFAVNFLVTGLHSYAGV